MEGSRLLGEPSRSCSPGAGDLRLDFPDRGRYAPAGGSGTAPPVQANGAPLWMHYDPYHGANYTLELPKGSPLPSASPNPYSSGEESADEDLEDQLDFQRNDTERLMLFLQGMGTQDCRLNYHDFVPELQGYDDRGIVCHHTFSNVIEKANSWLKQNPHIQVTSCETVTWTASNPIMIGDSETVVLDRCLSCHGGDTETDSYHVTGLRLWFSARSPQSTPRVHNHSSPVGEDGRCLGYRDYPARSSETLTTFLQRVNADLQTHWLQGRIVSVTSVFVPECAEVAPSQLVWRESQSRNTKHTLLLRLFYTVGPRCRELLGIKDIIPEPSKGNWETFSLLMRKATNWIRKESAVHVTNLQSVYVTRNQPTDSAKDSADVSCQSFRDCSTHQSFQLLRVYYVGRREEIPTQEHHVINCMTFTPVQTTLGPNTEAEFERMRQTMSRISAWLDLAGAKIRSAETFITPVSSTSANHTLPEMTLWKPSMLTSSSANLHKYLMHIRIYLDGDFSDPDPQSLPPLPYSLTAALQTTIQEREYNKYYSQKKSRKRRRKITLIVFLVILFIAVGIILCDQFFHIFRRFN